MEGFDPGQSLTRRFLNWYLAVRILVIALFLGGTAVSQLREGDGAGAVLLSWLYLLVAAAFGQSLIFLLLFARLRRWLLLFQAQVCWDLLFASCLIYLTGGMASPFSFLFILIIFSASFFLTRRDVYFVASAAAILYGSLIDLQYYEVLPAMPGAFPQQAIAIRDALNAVFLNVTGFFLVAFLSGLLIERLRQSEQARKKREIDYEELENLNRTILSNIPSGLLIVNPAGRIRSVNPGATQITGYRLEEIYNRKVGELFPELEVFENGDFVTVQRGETLLRDKEGGTRPVGFTSSLVRDTGAKVLGLLITFQDLSRLKEMEEQLKRADRLAAVGQLAAGMAHEIRNPLASISGSVQLLMEGAHVGDEDRRLMGIVVREAQRLNRLLTDFLVFARPAEPRQARVNVSEVLDELVSMLRGDERFDNISLKRDYPPGCELYCDRGQIHQALWNLLVNGAEAMPGGGTLRLGIDPAEALLYVEDSGPGIPEEIRHRIFDPFFTTKDHGTGLGLPTVYAIVEAHQGRLEVGSAAGGGARFVVRLTNAPPSQPPPAGGRRKFPPQEGKG
jgi:two-component system sensor histidine kinase PilS (NtrC family)